jgi:uncharacterized NAD(P)/FAD-binding protein YdhS
MDAGAVPQVVVVGGGFAGAAFALHLLRDHPTLPVSLTVVEPRAVLGAGLAYSTEDPAHRVNVAAARMSPFAEDPDHFDRWLRARGTAEGDPLAPVPGVGLFPRRAEFGCYVDEQVRAAASAAPGARFRHVGDRVVAAAPDEGGFRVALEGGGALHADVLVLAVGHPPPALPRPLRALAGDPRLVADPWDGDALGRVPRDGAVLILGTGLTGCDAVASLRARGHRGRLLAVSRRGLLPRPRTRLPVEPAGDFASQPAARAVELLRRVRAVVASEAAEGRPWEGVIDALRRQGGTVWGALPAAEKQRFLRHLRAFWDVHRFQCAPQIDALIRHEIAAGGLEVIAASVRDVTPEASGVRVRLHRRRTPEERVVERQVAAVVNCTGPASGAAVAENPALRSLADAGALLPDPHGLGILVDGQSRVVAASGAAWDTLLVAGPLARGTHGELMGLPQVSTQPREVAAAVARWLARNGARDAPFVQAARSRPMAAGT